MSKACNAHSSAGLHRRNPCTCALYLPRQMNDNRVGTDSGDVQGRLPRQPSGGDMGLFALICFRFKFRIKALSGRVLLDRQKSWMAVDWIMRDLFVLGKGGQRV